MIINSTTPLIKLATLEYPRNLAHVRAEQPHLSIPSSPTEAQLERLGYAVVVTTTKPIGDVVEEITPTLIDGKWIQAWTSRPYTTEEYTVALRRAKDGLIATAMDLRANELDAGVAYAFPNGAVKTVQTRDKDKFNLFTIKTAAETLLAQNVSDPVIEFRPEDDSSEWLTPAQALEMTMSIMAYMTKIMTNSWRFKEAVESVETLEDLPTLPSKLYDYI